jgi:hypothetical protein
MEDWGGPIASLDFSMDFEVNYARSYLFFPLEYVWKVTRCKKGNCPWSWDISSYTASTVFEHKFTFIYKPPNPFKLSGYFTYHQF